MIIQNEFYGANVIAFRDETYKNTLHLRVIRDGKRDSRGYNTSEPREIEARNIIESILLNLNGDIFPEEVPESIANMHLILREDRLQFTTITGKVAQVHSYEGDEDDIEDGVNDTVYLLREHGFRVENTTEYMDLENLDKIMQ